jgi:ribose/xylose/arabinose/galactoside ABC-type transport system permease subunit
MTQIPPAAGIIQAGENRGMNFRAVLSALGPVIGLVLVFILFSVLRPHTFPTVANASQILLQSVVVGVAALGTTPVIISAGIDISIGATIAVVSVATALLLNAGAPPILAAFGGIGVGALCGLFNGSCVTLLGLNPFIVTLGTFLAFRGVADVLGGESEVYTHSNWLNDLMNPSQALIFPWGVWIMIILAIALILMLRYTRFGRHIFAIGSNEQTARLCGIAVNRAKLWIYILGGAFSGIAGVLMFSNENGTGDPTTSKNTPLTAIAAAVIGGASLTGGQGSIVGTVIGAMFIMTIRNGCVQINLSHGVQNIVTGLIIIVAVLVDRLRNPKNN